MSGVATFPIIVLTVVVMVVGMAGAGRGLFGAPDKSGVAPLWFFLLAVLGSLLVAMVFLVVAEALVPSGSVTPILWLRGLRSRLARTRRYYRISAIAVRHG